MSFLSPLHGVGRGLAAALKESISGISSDLAAAEVGLSSMRELVPVRIREDEPVSEQMLLMGRNDGNKGNPRRRSESRGSRKLKRERLRRQREEDDRRGRK